MCVCACVRACMCELGFFGCYVCVCVVYVCVRFVCVCVRDGEICERGREREREMLCFVGQWNVLIVFVLTLHTHTHIHTHTHTRECNVREAHHTIWHLNCFLRTDITHLCQTFGRWDVCCTFLHISHKNIYTHMHSHIMHIILMHHIHHTHITDTNFALVTRHFMRTLCSN